MGTRGPDGGGASASYYICLPETSTKSPEDLAIFINQQLWIWELKKIRSWERLVTTAKYLPALSFRPYNQIFVPQSNAFRVSKISIQIKNL